MTIDFFFSLRIQLPKRYVHPNQFQPWDSRHLLPPSCASHSTSIRPSLTSSSTQVLLLLSPHDPSCSCPLLACLTPRSHQPPPSDLQLSERDVKVQAWPLTSSVWIRRWQDPAANRHLCLPWHSDGRRPIAGGAAVPNLLMLLQLLQGDRSHSGNFYFM